jgi:hypothetical protein
MNRNGRVVSLIIVLVAALLIAALPVAARPVRTYFTGMEFTCGAENGVEWYTRDGTKQHVRGQILHDVSVSDDPRVAGTSVHDANFNMDLLSGKGTVWGKAIVETEVGSWRLNYAGRFTDFVNYSGGGVGHGLGDLQGHLLFLEAQTAPVPEYNPCPGAFLGAYAISGYIQEP